MIFITGYNMFKSIEWKVSSTILFVVVNFLLITVILGVISQPNTVAVLAGIGLLVTLGCIDSLCIRKILIPMWKEK